MESAAEILNQFRAMIGDDRFRQFHLALESEPKSERRQRPPGLCFWQEDLWRQFRETSDLEVPSEYDDILELFSHVAHPHRLELEEAEVPAWCKIDALDGNCPVQGTGTVADRSWYFQARGEYWSLAVATEPGIDPLDLGSNDEKLWELEEFYDWGPMSAGWMSTGEARFFLVEGLKKFAAAHGIELTTS